SHRKHDASPGRHVKGFETKLRQFDIGDARHESHELSLQADRARARLASGCRITSSEQYAIDNVLLSRMSIALASQKKQRRLESRVHYSVARDIRCVRGAKPSLRRKSHEHDSSQGWYDDLLQRLGQRSDRNLLARLAAKLRCMGRPNVVPLTKWLSL